MPKLVPPKIRALILEDGAEGNDSLIALAGRLGVPVILSVSSNNDVLDLRSKAGAASFQVAEVRLLRQLVAQLDEAAEAASKEAPAPAPAVPVPACAGGPIAWELLAQPKRDGYVCYLCKRHWSQCEGIQSRGMLLHANCASAGARPEERVTADSRSRSAHLACSVCQEPWAPFPKQDEVKACDEAEQRAYELASRQVNKDPDVVGRRVKVRTCVVYGGFVHGDEGLGCWRCGESRQDHT